MPQRRPGCGPPTPRRPRARRRASRCAPRGGPPSLLTSATPIGCRRVPDQIRGQCEAVVSQASPPFCYQTQSLEASTGLIKIVLLASRHDMCMLRTSLCALGRIGYLSKTSLHNVGETRNRRLKVQAPLQACFQSGALILSVMIRCAGAGERGLPGGAADSVAG